jgi:hypothetical protein
MPVDTLSRDETQGMNEETKAQDQKLIDEYYARQRVLDGGTPSAAEWLDLARLAADAGLPKDAALHLLKAGELDPENQRIREGLKAGGVFGLG